MLQSLQQDTRSNLTQVVLRRIIPVLVVAFLGYIVLIATSVYNTVGGSIITDHEQANTEIQAQLRSNLDLLQARNEEIANSDELRSQAGNLLINNEQVSQVVNGLFANLIRLDTDEYLAVQYITSNGVIFNEVINERGIPVVSDASQLRRSEPAIIQSTAFQNALQASSTESYYISDFELTVDDSGVPISPLQVSFSIYVPVFDLNNPRTPLGTIRFLIDANQLLSNVNNPILSETSDGSGRQFFLVDNLGNVIANSDATSQDYLLALANQELTTNTDEFQNLVQNFVDSNEGEVTLQAQDGLLYTVRNFNTLDDESLTWRIVVTDSQSTLISSFAIAILFIAIATLVVLGIIIIVLNRTIAPILEPLTTVSQQAQQIATGQGRATTTNFGIQGGDEALAQPISSALNSLSGRIQELAGQLDEQSTRYNRDMQIISNIGRETATLYNIDDLMQRSIELICNELGFYHAQIFLVDDANVNAVLVKSRGEAGVQLLAQEHKLAVGSDSIIGRVTSQLKPVIVNDTTKSDSIHGFNPLLPDTRAEMALPLVIAGNCIGALDIQSTNANVFLNVDVPKFQLIADQLAVAIYNARLREQTDQRFEQINRLNRQLTGDAWTDLEQELGLDTQYSYNLMDITSDTHMDATEGSLTAPISIRGEVIGTLNATPPDGHSFSDGDQVILRAVAERVALAIENARLFQETQVVLSETEILYELSRKLSEAISYDQLTAAILEVVVPNAHGGQIWIFDDYLTDEAPEWAELRTKSEIIYTEDERVSNVVRLHLTDHPLMEQLNGTDVITIDDIQNNPDVDSGLLALTQQMGARSMVIIPLSMRGQWKGFINIYFNTVHNFTERETRIYNALIDQAGVAIDNRLLLEQTEFALERNEKLYSASRIINTANTLQDLIKAAVSTSDSNQLDYWLGVFDYNDNLEVWQSPLRIVAQSQMGATVEASDLHTVSIPDTSPLRNGELEILTDNPDSSWMWQTGHKFIAAIPLFSDNLPLALFFILSYDEYQLTEEDYEIYRALAGQMSTQIQNTRLLEQTELALAETQRLYIASRAISGANDIDSIFESAAGHLALPFMQSPVEQRLLISLIEAFPSYEQTAPQMRYRYQWTSDMTVPFSRPTGSIAPSSETPYATLFDSRTSSIYYADIANDLVDNPKMQNVLMEDGGQSVLLTVLQTRQNWYGVLVCTSNITNAFDERYIEFAQAVANQISIGIENQILLNAAQAEQERLQTILSTLPTGVMVLDPTTFVPVLTNDSTRRLLGEIVDTNTPLEPVAYNLYRTDTNQPYDREELPVYKAAASGEGVMADNIAMVTESGRVELLLNAAPIFDSSGNQTAIVVAVQDISNLRNLEQTLQKNLRETVSLYEVQRTVAQAETLDDLFDTIMIQMVLLQPDDALILMNDVQTNQVVAARQMANSIDDVRGLKSILPIEDMLNIPDVGSHQAMTPEANFVFEQLNAQSAITLALRVPNREQTLGWLMLTKAIPNGFTIDDERSLITLSDMARTAIDNRYLVQSTQDALQETQVLYDATASITRSGDIFSLGFALEEAIQALNPDMLMGFVEMSPVEEISLFNQGFDEVIDAGLNIDILKTEPLPNADELYISDLTSTSQSAFEAELLNSDHIKSFIAISLRIKENKNGRIFIGFKDTRTFTDGDIRFLRSLADSASVVIDNQVLLEQVHATLQETSVLYQSSRALTDATTPSEIIDVVVNYLIGPHVNQVFVALLNTRQWDTPGAIVEVGASWHTDDGVDLEGVTLSADQFPAWEQLSSPEVLIIGDINDESLGLDIMQRTSIESLDTQSLVVIPLRAANRAIGSIWIGSREPHNYGTADTRIYQSFAESASLSLEASYLFAQTEHRAQQLETSAQVGQSIGQLLDLDVLLPQVVELIRERFSYDHVQVFLMDDRDEYAVLEASTGEAGEKLLGVNHKLAKGSNSVIGRVTEMGDPTIALDTADANVVHQPNQYLPLTRSEMALPLQVKGQIVGALDVQSNLPNAFTEEDVRALTTLAGQIAIAIDNANLYNEIERRASDMSLLFDTIVVATASDTLENALHSVTENLFVTFDASATVFYLPQKTADQTILTPIALSGTEQPISELSEVIIGDQDNLIGSISQSLNAEMIQNIGTENRYVPIAQNSASGMVVPVSTGGQLIGVIVVEHAQANYFTQDDLQVVITLAGSLSAIIQNSILVDELQETNDQLREVDRMKSQFLANMSHELRTPLNSIIGFSRVMLKGIDGPLTEMQEQDLTTIYNSGQHLLNLINDILDQAKLESGKMDLKFGFFGIKTMIESVKSIGIGLVKEKPIDILIDLESGLPDAFGDEFRTRQILLNLISNAAKFTQEGGITLRAYTVDVQNSETPYIRIDVVDTGIGIDEKDIPVLFQTFRQVDSSLTRTVGGTGLGLPLSKSLAEMQGGELLVASEVGTGSTFSITIPTEEVISQDEANEVEAQDIYAEDKPDTKATRPTIVTPAVQDPNATTPIDKRVITQTMKQTTKREVLLIEDNKDMVDQFRRLIQREGFEVQTADHPAYAEAMVSNLRPTVLVMDVNFADGEGWNILERLKQRDDTFDIPIVVCSVNPDSERAYQMGAHKYIGRPFTNEDIVDAVLDAEKESQRERILIIDDQPQSIRLLEELLNENENYRIFSADNGTEGISLVARRRPDLIILDLRMPNMDGFAVLNELRSNPETAEIPVMVVTGELDLSADEQLQLANILVLRKTDISEEEYDQFVKEVREHLNSNGS